jgi:hypothetical protein
MKDCICTPAQDHISYGIHAPATPNGVDYGDCRIALHRSYFKTTLLGNLSYLGGKHLCQSFPWLKKRKGQIWSPYATIRTLLFLLILAHNYFLNTFAKRRALAWCIFVQMFQQHALPYLPGQLSCRGWGHHRGGRNGINYYNLQTCRHVV